MIDPESRSILNIQHTSRLGRVANAALASPTECFSLSRQHDLWRLHTVTEHRDPCGVRGAWTVVHFSRGGPRASKPARVDDCGRNARHVPKPKVWGYSIRE